MSIRVHRPTATRHSDPTRTITAVFHRGPAHGRALDLDLGALGLDQPPPVIEYRAGHHTTLYRLHRRRTRPPARRHTYIPDPMIRARETGPIQGTAELGELASWWTTAEFPASSGVAW